MNNVIIAGFKTGEVNRNDTTTPNGAPFLIKPARTGIVGHEQNGVMFPSDAPKMSLTIFFIGGQEIHSRFNAAVVDGIISPFALMSRFDDTGIAKNFHMLQEDASAFLAAAQLVQNV